MAARALASKARGIFTTLMAAMALAAAAQDASAQTPTDAQVAAWPNRTITLIAPNPPGGGFDTVARVLAVAAGDRAATEVAGGWRGARTANRLRLEPPRPT